MAHSTASDVHLCVFVHGLWGNPSHLNQVAAALTQAHSDDSLELLIAKRNTGNSTYDGVELGGERVAQEIEDRIAEIEKDGRQVKRFSIIGYSLGGLVARYTIGLLYSRKLFDKIEPINFTTFATPHLGVRTFGGWASNLWNEFGGRTISVSGMQLFLIDKFRDTNRPLLAVLADPNTIFMKALALFQRRSLYANIINDRAVPFYTAYICSTDPFTDMTAIDINYIPDYEDVILDSRRLATPRTQQLTRYEALTYTAKDVATKLPFWLLIGFVGIPLGSTVFLVNAGLQAYYSAQRIKLHESGKAGIGISAYRLPLMIQNVQKTAERALEHGNNAQPEDFLPNKTTHLQGSHEEIDSTSTSAAASSATSVSDKEQETKASKSTAVHHGGPTKQQGDPAFPTLALTTEQFTMISNLDAADFEKFAVHIHNAPHSHAAIVVRTQRQAFREGRIVLRHWAERFVV